MTAQTDGARGKRPRKAKNASTPSQEASNEPPLSRERIIAAAVDLLDAQGLDGLSMRRLADRLGAGAMSLYWHVDNKEVVLDLALDTVLAYQAPPHSDQPRQWRGDVLAMLEDWRAVMLRHPWSAALLPRRALGPNMLGRLELLGQALSAAGIADTDLNAAIWSLWNYVMGATLTRASFDVSDDDRTATHEWLAGLDAAFPTIQRSRLLLDSDWDGAFNKGLGFLLDGLVP